MDTDIVTLKQVAFRKDIKVAFARLPDMRSKFLRLISSANLSSCCKHFSCSGDNEIFIFSSLETEVDATLDFWGGGNGGGGGMTVHFCRTFSAILSVSIPTFDFVVCYIVGVRGYIEGYVG